MVALSVQIEIAGGLSWPRWKRIVAEVDRLGYRGLYCCDHFYPSGSGYVDAVEIGLAFGYLADHSARLEFGALVSPVSFRDPVWLARDALALDNLSGGRFILGVGAGWMEREHVGFGYELGDRKTRMARLSEALKVIDLLTRREGPVSHSGRFYHLQDAVLLPQSPRPGGPRLMIGGAGPLRTLPLTAKYADIWNVGPRAPEAFRESSDLLSDLLVKAERQPGDVRRTQMIQIICYRGNDLAPRVRHLLAEMPGLDAAAALAAQRARSPHTIVGTPAEVIDRIGAHAAAGVEEIMVQRFDLDDMEGVAIIAEDVLPKV